MDGFDGVKQAAQAAQRVGRIVSVLGCQAVFVLERDAQGTVSPMQIGALVKVLVGQTVVYGAVSGLSIPVPSTEPGAAEMRVVELTLIGEMTAAAPGRPSQFRRGVSFFPSLGDPVFAAARDDFVQVYAPPAAASVSIGTLYHDRSIQAHGLTDELLGKRLVNPLANLLLGGLTLGAAAGLSGFTGRTGDDDWRRVITTGALVAGTARAYVSGDFLYGSATRGKSGQIWLAHEAFLAGGSPVPFVDGLHVSQRLAVPGAPPGFAHGARVATYKLSVGGLPFEPFALWAGGGDEITSLTRMAGAERSFSTATLGFVRLPAIRARAGAAWLFDDSFGRRLRAWASVIYSP